MMKFEIQYTVGYPAVGDWEDMRKGGSSYLRDSSRNP